MVEKVKALLQGRSENHLAPFFWQHGEDEAALREYMAVVQGSGCGAVCVESRPHVRPGADQAAMGAGGGEFFRQAKPRGALITGKRGGEAFGKPLRRLTAIRFNVRYIPFGISPGMCR